MSDICPRCKRVVDLMDQDGVIWDAGMRRYWHEPCMISKLMMRLTVLQKKLTRGTLTAEEAKEADEINLELKGYKEAREREQIEDKDVKMLREKLRKALTSIAVIFSNKDPHFVNVVTVSEQLRIAEQKVKRLEGMKERAAIGGVVKETKKE